MGIKAVIFDLDDTLTDRQRAFRTYSERFIDAFVALDNGMDRLALVDYMVAADRGGYRKKRELYEEFRKNLNMKKQDLSVEELLEYWFSEFSKCTTLTQGAEELLQYIKTQPLKLGLITNGSIQAQHAKINMVNIRHYFDAIIVSDEVQCKKPEKRIYELMCERLDVAAEQCLFVGDHPINDVHGASEAGLQAIWYKGNKTWDESLKRPETTIEQLDELIHILKNFNYV